MEHDIITSEDYTDLIVESTDSIKNIINNQEGIYSYHFLNDEYIVVHIRNDKLNAFLAQISESVKTENPLPMGLLDERGFIESGIENIQNQPYLQLRGQGVIIAIIDTGIDFLHKAFIKADNTTKILRIWDQSIKGTPPDGFYMGEEYTQEEINDALKSDDPRSIIEHIDEDGHGTFIAGIAAGNDLNTDYIGVAPDAELVVVKVKKAKNNFKYHWAISESKDTVYESIDLVLALRYVIGVARDFNRPIVINNSFGTNNGAHDDSGIIYNIVNNIGVRQGFTIVSAAGNEGIARHHASGVIPEDLKTYDIEVRSADNETGFCVEIWVNAPDLVSLLIKSPLNNYVEVLPSKSLNTETSGFLLEKTTVTVTYYVAYFRNGQQLLLLYFRDPTPGVWTITLRSIIYLKGEFNAWLPMQPFLEGDTFFLNSNPESTVTVPGNFSSLISVGAYNHRDGSMYVNSGRGPSRSERMCPDLVAPGVNIEGPWLNNTYTNLSGTSVAAAIVSGCAALLLEWGIIQQNDPLMNTYKVKYYLTAGAQRDSNVTYPNNILGYGKLDIYKSFSLQNLKQLTIFD